MSLKCHSVSVVVCFNFSLLSLWQFVSTSLSCLVFHSYKLEIQLHFLLKPLCVREQRVIQALAVCSTLKPLIWLAWMQSVSSPTYGTAEDTETFLEQTSSAAGGGVTQGKSCLSSWHLSRQTHYSPAGCSIQNHCEVRKKINY